MLNTPGVAEIVDPAIRERAFATIAAAALVAAAFEQIEGVIWASQVQLLSDLNALPMGMDSEQAKARYYDTATARFPAHFANYPFDSYLRFPASFGLLAEHGQTLEITERGREYLLWRVRSGKGSKFIG